MKTVTIFLVAVTLFTSSFQQSSAAPQSGFSLGQLVGKLGGTVGKTVESVGDITGTAFDDILNIMDKDVEEETDETANDIDSILLELNEAAKSAVNKKHSAVKNTNDEFKSKTNDAADDTDKVKSKSYDAVDDTNKVKSKSYDAAGDTDKVKSKTYAAADDTDEVKSKTYAASDDTDEVKSKTYAASDDTDEVKSKNYDAAGDTDKVKSKTYDAAGDTDKVKSKIYDAADDTDKVKSKTYDAAGDTDKVKSKTNDAVDDNDDEFESLIAKAIESCSESLATIVNAVKKAILTATCYHKKGLKKADEYLDGLKDLVEKTQNDLRKAVNDKTLLKDLAARIPKDIADTEATVPRILANLGWDVKAIFKENLESMIEEAKTVLVAIEKRLAA